MPNVIARLIFGLGLCAQAQTAGATPAIPKLEALIKQNVSTAADTTKQLSNLTAPAQLWIHVRSDSQLKLVENNLSWLKTLRVGGSAIDVGPLEVVKIGPQKSELRYFQPSDQVQARQLQSELASGIPQLQLHDLSKEYQAVQLAPGHFEVWLAPDVSQFGPGMR
jgi:hypothetical protein